jgi:hypothetical protein
MSEDPKGFQAGDYNLYRYCFNDPLDRSDPMGLEQEYALARVTAYGYGPDNRYAGHPDGGDAVAHTSDRSRIGGGVSHAVLGDGTFAHPTSIAVNPKSGIAMDSMVYVKGIGWFKVEDRASKNLPTNTFDMWSGRSNAKERADLTGPRNVTVYGPKEEVPKKAKEQGPGPKWNFAPPGNTRSAEPVQKPTPRPIQSKNSE